MFLLLGEKSSFWLDDYWELKFDWLMSYDVYMGDNIKATRSILRVVKKPWYHKVLYSFEEVFMEILLLFGNIAYSGLLINCSCFLYPDHAITPCPIAKHITDMRYFARSKLSRRFVPKKNFSFMWLVAFALRYLFCNRSRIPILSLNKLGEKLQAKIIISKFVNKP